MEYRLTKHQLFEVLEEWNQFLRRKVHLIACGGTAMTLLGVKESTKDIDFMAPNLREHAYLTRTLEDLGYKPETSVGWKRPGEIFQFDLFRGNFIHTTGLLESPLREGRHTLLKSYSRLYIGILNDYDLIVSKLMRGTQVDFDDCLRLSEAHIKMLDIRKLVDHYNEMIMYDVGEERLKSNITYFVQLLRERNLYE